MLPISVYIGSIDFTLLEDIVNQGIDARLTGFVDSEFYQKGSRYHFDFADNEVEILLRRLHEIADNDNFYFNCDPDISDMADIACQWETDILQAVYDIEIY